MKTRLSLKIFAAFLITLVVIVGLMVGIMQLYSARNFADYVNRVEIESMEDLLEELARLHERDQGWDQLKDNGRLWRQIQESYRPSMEMEGPPGLPPDRHRGPPRRPMGADRENRNMDREIRNEGGPGQPPREPDPKRIGHRLTVFDGQKMPVVGPGASTDLHTLKAITVEGKTVGWLGLMKMERLSHPLDEDFMQQQVKAFYIIGGCILVLAAGVSFLLSRHMLAPIRNLIRGTQALTSLKFDTRIQVETRDELGRLAADFNEMAGTLERYETQQQQWLSDISHELRTPLSVLQGEIEALQDGVRGLSPERLASLHSEALRLNRIVKDLHDLSLAESGAFHFSRKPVNPIKVLRAALAFFHNRFEEYGITLQDDLEEDSRVILEGDEHRLFQLFSNLLENTLRFTDSPGSLRIWQQMEPGEWVLHFEDSAPGVPEADLDRLFDRLFRVDSSRSRVRGGSGLGLSICRKIVEAHGGRILALPAEAGGLSVQIRFPCPKGDTREAESC